MATRGARTLSPCATAQAQHLGGLLPPAMSSAIQSTPEDPLQQAAQAYAFRQLVAHLQARTDVQNIEMMILSGFCRNVSATRI